MSSVLKALRQQQSQLIPTQAAIALAPARTSPATVNWLKWLLIPIAGLAGWLIVAGLTAPTQLQTTSAPPPQSSWQVGEPQPVRHVAVIAPRATAAKPAPEVERPTVSSFTSPQSVPVEQGVDLNEVPADLLSAFEEAIAATGQGPTEQSSVLPRINELQPTMQSRIPSFSYDAHQYSSRTHERFISLAGQRLRQGDLWQGIQVLTIAPNHVVLALGKQAFQQPALEDWTSSD
ncbi:hypothetical protein PSI9734_02298 [Pseudidiomarina piscicola]|uniref:Type II secretion system protein GspB C-terminal domain-containing protein n=1 Tax=Pseudidiomarina piscicola TaxID=2614830 RepID=A0A6S6WMA0_9GAMM|nr:general secretion pathway protein GspB [Pseudidiomarina piscicola]CAB0151944.1 hypothetical protein PSI9734_02298 [Pseudidiomarina piscicola]VZT41383.1 hypothetical protein PSI9734_02298 [Pseudomonas aeruginosa]